MKLKLVKSLGIIVAASLFFPSSAYADQTIAIDLNNFQDDGLGRLYPNYTISGVNDGDVVTINVSNAAEGFLGYINDGAGNSLNVSNGGAVNITNNTGQFYGVGSVSALSYNNVISGNYTVTVTIGAEGLFSQNEMNEKPLADETSDPLNAVGWLVLEWRDNFVNQNNWKQVSLVRSGSPATSRASNSLKVLSRPEMTQEGNQLTCTSGSYKFLNGGSTEEESKLEALIYTLYIDGVATSRVGSENLSVIPTHFFEPISGQIAGSANLESATWDITGSENFDAYCTVYAWERGANMQSSSIVISDVVKKSIATAKAEEMERQRALATAANFTKEAREARKRAAARATNP